MMIIILVCTKTKCTMEIGDIFSSISIYFLLTTNNYSCLINPQHGIVLLRTSGIRSNQFSPSIHSVSRLECLPSVNNRCLQPYPTRRIMFNYYYDFLYVPIYTTNRFNSGSTSSITLNNNDLSIYSYEFMIDDRNLGGTLHFDFESRVMVKMRWPRMILLTDLFSSRLYLRM